MSRLSPQQVKSFQDEGFLIVPDIFAPGDLEPLRRELHGEINKAIRALHADGKLTDLHANEDFDHQLSRIYDDNPENGKGVIRHLEGNAGGGFTGREMFNTIVNPKLLAVVESLVGPEIVASSVYRLRPKIPGINRGNVPWHQDSGYFDELCDKHLVLTVWVPLISATLHNGCMSILPRAHRQGVATHHSGGNAGFLVVEEQDLPVAAEKAVVAECPLGGAVFMTNLTPHCSTHNHSDRIRWSVDLRYQSADAPNNATLLPKTGVTMQPPEFQIACYAPEADFVVQSHAHPERVTNYEEFAARRRAFDEAARARTLRYPDRGWTPLAAATK